MKNPFKREAQPDLFTCTAAEATQLRVATETPMVVGPPIRYRNVRRAGQWKLSVRFRTRAKREARRFKKRLEMKALRRRIEAQKARV